MKLQDAFIAENGDFYGSFAKIGYEIGETTNFKYTSSLEDGTAALAEATGVWDAESKTALNDCVKQTHWQLNLNASSSGNGAAWTTNVSSLGDACMALTPRFDDHKRGTAKSGT